MTPPRRQLGNFTGALGRLWVQNRSATALELLRIGLGGIWMLNLIFIVDPRNDFFGTFQATALAFAPTSATGPSVALFVGTHSTLFALAIAGVTLYLAVALVLGITTRGACAVGAAFSISLLLAQWGSTFVFPGGTDVGPHPLYLVLYGSLYLGGAGRFLALGSRWSEGAAATGTTRLPSGRGWWGQPSSMPRPQTSGAADGRRSLLATTPRFSLSGHASSAKSWEGVSTSGSLSRGSPVRHAPIVRHVSRVGHTGQRGRLATRVPRSAEEFSNHRR